MVSDGVELWHFHIMAGIDGTSAIWAAQRVPDDHVTSLPNSFVIRNMVSALSGREGVHTLLLT